jgi:adenylate kinase
VAARVTEAASKDGFVLDGYPRNLSQAEEASQMARDKGTGIDAAVYLDVRPAELQRRLLGRSGVQSRRDDREAIVRHRLEVFDRLTRPLIDYYRERGRLISVNGEQPVEKVTHDIVNELAARPSADPWEAAARPSPGSGRRPTDGGSR